VGGFDIPPGAVAGGGPAPTAEDIDLGVSDDSSYDVHVVTFGEEYASCFGNSSTVSSLTSTFITDRFGNLVKVSNLTQPITFLLPLGNLDQLNSSSSTVVEQCDGSLVETGPDLVCQWWDDDANGWSADGCETLGIVTNDVGFSSMRCACDHLTGTKRRPALSCLSFCRCFYFCLPLGCDFVYGSFV
jgi:hypothetical protein